MRTLLNVQVPVNIGTRKEYDALEFSKEAPTNFPQELKQIGATMWPTVLDGGHNCFKVTELEWYENGDVLVIRMECDTTHLIDSADEFDAEFAENGWYKGDVDYASFQETASAAS